MEAAAFSEMSVPIKLHGNNHHDNEYMSSIKGREGAGIA
jgi:hypothetical protein